MSRSILVDIFFAKEKSPTALQILWAYHYHYIIFLERPPFLYIYTRINHSVNL